LDSSKKRGILHRAANVLLTVRMNEKRILVFDRTPVARIVSIAASCAAGALFFSYLSEPPIDALPLTGLALLCLGTLAAAFVQYGDHIYVGDDGVMYENWLLKRLGRHGRWMRWEDIVEVREIRDRVLILLSRDGRRMLVDAIFGYAIARAEILRRAPHAIVSGTLARDET
jgi:hypothetical protein